MIRIALLLALLALAACAGVEPLPMPQGPWVQLNTNLQPPPTALVMSRQDARQ
jgi:aconitase B